MESSRAVSVSVAHWWSQMIHFKRVVEKSRKYKIERVTPSIGLGILKWQYAVAVLQPHLISTSSWVHLYVNPYCPWYGTPTLGLVCICLIFAFHLTQCLSPTLSLWPRAMSANIKTRCPIGFVHFTVSFTSIRHWCHHTVTLVSEHTHRRAHSLHDPSWPLCLFTVALRFRWIFSYDRSSSHCDLKFRPLYFWPLIWSIWLNAIEYTIFQISCLMIYCKLTINLLLFKMLLFFGVFLYGTTWYEPRLAISHTHLLEDEVDFSRLRPFLSKVCCWEKNWEIILLGVYD